MVEKAPRKEVEAMCYRVQAWCKSQDSDRDGPATGD
jgi:hypothetical protein